MDQDGKVCKLFSEASVQLPVDRDRTWIAACLALPHNRAMFFHMSWKSRTAPNVLVFIEILPFASLGSRSAFARDAGANTYSSKKTRRNPENSSHDGAGGRQTQQNWDT